MSTALLIIDMQNGFLDEYQDRSNIPMVCEVINYCAQLMRDAGQTVVHIRDIEEAEEMSEEALATTMDIDIKPTDLHIEKTYSNAFYNTELKVLLEEQGVDFVIIAGQAAEHCVVFTYNGAIEQGFTPTVLQHAVLSNKHGRAEALMEDRNVISHAAIRGIIRKE